MKRLRQVHPLAWALCAWFLATATVTWPSLYGESLLLMALAPIVLVAGFVPAMFAGQFVSGRALAIVRGVLLALGLELGWWLVFPTTRLLRGDSEFGELALTNALTVLVFVLATLARGAKE